MAVSSMASRRAASDVMYAQPGGRGGGGARGGAGGGSGGDGGCDG